MQDREQASRVRTLALSEIEKQLKKGKGSLYEAVLIKLAGSVLPRLNEHTGDDGNPISIMFDNSFKKPPQGARKPVKKNASSSASKKGR